MTHRLILVSTELLDQDIFNGTRLHQMTPNV